MSECNPISRSITNMEDFRMKKRYMIALIALFILLLGGGGFLYCSYAVFTDSNGLTKKDVADAENTLCAYVDALHSGNIDFVMNTLADYHMEMHGNDPERVRQLYEDTSSFYVYEDFQCQYDEQTSARQVPSDSESRPEALAGKKMIYLPCAFDLRFAEDTPENMKTSGEIEVPLFSGYGYYMVRENGGWKIVDYGF